MNKLTRNCTTHTRGCNGSTTLRAAQARVWCGRAHARCSFKFAGLSPCRRALWDQQLLPGPTTLMSRPQPIIPVYRPSFPWVRPGYIMRYASAQDLMARGRKNSVASGALRATALDAKVSLLAPIRVPRVGNLRMRGVGTGGLASPLRGCDRTQIAN